MLGSMVNTDMYVYVSYSVLTWIQLMVVKLVPMLQKQTLSASRLLKKNLYKNVFIK